MKLEGTQLTIFTAAQEAAFKAASPPTAATPTVYAADVAMHVPEVSDNLFQALPEPAVSENLLNDPRIANTLKAPE